MKKTKLFTVAMLLSCMFMIAGCGSENTKYEEAMQQLSTGAYANAIAIFDEATENGENQRLISRGKGIAYLGNAQYEEAANCFLDALSRSNGFVQDMDVDINLYLAECYIGLEDYDAADEVYTSILALYETSRTYYLRGRVRLMQGMYTIASNDFNHATTISPRDINLYIKIYESFEEYGYRESGIEYLDKALGEYENNMSALERGKIYYYKEEYQTAAVALEEARSADNNSSQASLYLGMTYEAVGENNYASNVYESYLARNPEDAAVLNQLAVCKMKLGDYEGALSKIEDGFAVGDISMTRTLLFNEIVAYEYLGDFDSAKTLMNSYLKTYPSDEAALREQIFLSTR